MRLFEVTPFRFLLTLGFLTVAGQGLLASAAVEAAIVVPFAHWQGALAERYLVGGPLNVSVVPSCSGLDVMALCVAAILAFPASWQRRLAGAAIGIGGLLLLNLVRIATLAQAAQSPAFATLHLVVWPALLVLATAAWVAIWIWSAQVTTASATVSVWRRYLVWIGAFLGAYVVTVPLLTTWQVLDLVAADVGHLAVQILNTLGVEASLTGRLLQTGGAAYLVTSECVTTPLVAVYLGVASAAPIGWRRRSAAFACALPLFLSLAVVRLLTVAVPPLMVGSELILTHAFHQMVAGLTVLALWAIWARPGESRLMAAGLALLVAAVVGTGAALVGGTYSAALAGVLRATNLPFPTPLVPIAGTGDLQGAILILPTYQAALFLGASLLIWSRIDWARWAVGGAVLVALQLASLAGLGWLEAASIPTPPPLWIRAWAVAVPMAVLLGVSATSRARRAPALTMTSGPLPE